MTGVIGGAVAERVPGREGHPGAEALAGRPPGDTLAVTGASFGALDPATPAEGRRCEGGKFKNLWFSRSGRVLSARVKGAQA